MIYAYLPIYNKRMQKFKGRKKEAKIKKNPVLLARSFCVCLYVCVPMYMNVFIHVH